LLAYLLALVVLLVAGLLAFFAGTFLPFTRHAPDRAVALIVLAGLIAAVVILVLHYRARKRQAANGELPAAVLTRKSTFC